MPRVALFKQLKKHARFKNSFKKLCLKKWRTIKILVMAEPYQISFEAIVVELRIQFLLNIAASNSAKFIVSTKIHFCIF